jgi:predicted RNA polymerase sigma factor
LAEVQSRLGYVSAAMAAYDRAIELAENPQDALFLQSRRKSLGH